MNYNWYIAGTMLHLMTDDYNGRTLCNRLVTGRSYNEYNEVVTIMPTCKTCMKLKDQVAMRT